MARSFLDDNNCLQVKWKKPDYYFDIFPADFFEKACSNEKKSFHVYWDKKNPEFHLAECRLSVRGAKAKIDCSDININAESGFEQGIMFIHFTDSKRNLVKRVDWQPKGGELLEDQAMTNCDIDEAIEGRRYVKEMEVISRNYQLMQRRKKKDNHTCQACSYRLEVEGKFISDCHHLKLHSSDKQEKITEINELVTLCPNCHRIAHSRAKPYTVNQIKQILNKARISDQTS